MPASGAVQVVLGGSGTIGAAISRRMVRQGSALVLGCLENTERAERLAADLAPCAREVRVVAGNIADSATLKEIALTVSDLGDRCEALVHCVGLTSFKPLTGRVGVTVTIRGTHFTGATSVTFNGKPASFTVDRPRRIKAIVPAGATTGPITVTTPGGTAISTRAFTVTP